MDDDFVSESAGEKKMKIGQYLMKLQVVKKLLPKHTDTCTSD